MNIERGERTNMSLAAGDVNYYTWNLGSGEIIEARMTVLLPLILYPAKLLVFSLWRQQQSQSSASVSVAA